MTIKKSLLYKYMPFAINAEPYIITSSKGYIELSDEKIIQHYGVKSLSSLLFNCTMLVVPIMLLLIIWGTGSWDTEATLHYLLFPVPFAIPAIINILFYLTGPEKTVVYHRLDGTVTLPNSLWGKPRTIPFINLEAVLSHVGGIQAPGLILAARFPRKYWWDRFKPSVHLGFGVDPYRGWAFIIWYMDKNRPLPPGEVFDPYRSEDAKRRAIENNPAPLFSSFF